MKKIIMLGATLILLLTSCSQKKNAEVIRYLNFKVYDPVYLALDAGFFEKYNVKVEIIGDLLAGPTAIQAVSAGAAEAGLASVPSLVNASAAGLPVIGVVDAQTTFENQALQQFYVRADSPYNSATDLENARFAINLKGSSFHYTALLMFANQGFNELNVDWFLLPFDKQLPALIEGSVDVISLIQPYQSLLAATYPGEFKVLATDYHDAFNDQSRMVSVIFVNRVFAEHNPEVVSRFTSAIAEAIEWSKTNQDEARRIISKYTGVPETVIDDYYFTEYGEIRKNDVQFWLDFLRMHGDVTDEQLSVDDVVTNQYNQFVGGN